MATLFAPTSFLYAQNSGIRVSGQLKDSMNHEKIAYGSVLLKNLNTKQQFTLNTDSTGHFKFAHIPMGQYVFKAYFVGYPQIEKQIRIFSSNGHQNLGNILMTREHNVLETVHVTGYKDLIKNRPDGITYLASQDPTNKGASAAEMLRKVPMLTVDMDDNLELRGNGNVKVLIDGKPSSIIAASVSDVLKQIPADNIKAVEVITSPGAKYDAEGSAGVINIITKKTKISGFSGRVHGALSYNLVDKHFRGFGGIDLNYRYNKFGISAKLGGGHWSHTSVKNSERTNHPGTPNETLLKQSTFNDGGGTFLWGNLNSYYDIDSLNSISAGFGVHPGNWKSESRQTTLFPARQMDYIQNTTSSSPRQSYSFNAGYNKKFKDNKHHTLDILALYSINHRNRGYKLHQNDQPEDVLSYREKSSNLSKKGEFTFQTDYVQPLKNHHQKIETGIKYINRNVFSNYDLYTWKTPSNKDWTIDPERTNQLKYTQQVAAAYGQFTTDLGQKLSLIGGLRYEFTSIKGHLRDNGGTFNSQFNNILPSLILSYKMRNFDRLNLSYTQRIERPSIRYINPYARSSDQLNYTIGNPELGPEQTHKVELDYNTVLGQSSINAALFYSLTKNGIEQWTDIDSKGAAVTTYGNYGKGNTFGLNLFGSTTLFHRWRINLNGNLYHRSLSGQNLSNQGWEYDAHFSSDVQIYKGLSVNAFGMYRGRHVTLQGYRSGWYRYSLGLKQKLFDGKGDISLSATNFLSPNTQSISDYTYGDAHFYNVSYWRSRGIRLSFSYTFGKMKVQKKKRKSIRNTDLKEGNGNRDEGGGMGGS